MDNVSKLKLCRTSTPAMDRKQIDIILSKLTKYGFNCDRNNITESIEVILGDRRDLLERMNKIKSFADLEIDVED